MTVFETDVALPRNAFGPRDTARAADLWRAAQDVAVAASTDRGWPPSRYRDASTAFVVRAGVGIHHREVRFGEPLHARSWVSDFRRDTFSARQVQVFGTHGLIFDVLQEWVHVQMPDGRMCRASPELRASFEVARLEPLPELPETQLDPVPDEGFKHTVFHVAMDPLGHVNHPATLDLAEECVARWFVARGGDPQAVEALGERIVWKLPIHAEPIHIVVVGHRDGVFAVEIRLADGRVAADVVLHRRLIAHSTPSG